MVDAALSAARLLFAFFLVFMNGFFVAAEFAYVRIRATTVESLVEEGRSGATLLQDAMENLDDYLAVTQLGITLASLGLGWAGEPAIAALVEPVLGSVLPSGLIHLVAIAIGFSVITFLHVVFGELAPKTLAIAQAERIALLVAAPMKFFYYVFYPGLVVFNGTANAFTRLIGVPPASETDETLEEEELRMVLSRSGREGHVDKTEVEMIERVFELDDTTVREVMIPRPDVVSVPADLPLSELRTLIVDEGHTRYPILDEGDSEQVVGFVDVKDVLRATEAGRTSGSVEAADADASAASTTAGDLARELPVVPETGQIDDLLTTFQDDRSQMAAIIDEWGSFEGIATVEDVVEEIVGDLRDDFDADGGEPSIERQDDGTYAVDGGISVSEVNETVGTDFEVEGVETVGGLVLDRLGRAPEVGDRIEVDGYEFDVQRVEGARISAVTVRETPPEDELSEETNPGDE